MRRFMTTAGLFVLLGLAAMACGTSVNVTAGSDTSAADSDAGDGSQGTTDEASAEEASADEGSADEGSADEASADEAGAGDEEPAGSDDTSGEVDLEIDQLAAASALIGANDTFGAEVEADPEAVRCAAAGIVDSPPLFDYLVASPDADFEALPPELVDPAADIVVRCLDDATFASLIAEGLRDADFAVPPGTGDCFASELDTAEKRKAVVKLGFIADDAVPDPAEFDKVIDAILACVPPEVWTDLAVEGMDVPAEMQDALDTACLDRVFAEPDFMRLLLSEALTGELDSPEITPQQAPLVRGVFDCIDFGQAIAAEAALDGITLSPGSVECLSRQFRELGFVEYFIEGTEPSDADLGAMVIDCLTTEELLDLGGS